MALNGVICWQFPNPLFPGLTSCHFFTNNCLLDISIGCQEPSLLLHVLQTALLSDPYLGNWYHHSSSCSGQTLFSFLMPISNPKVILGGLPPICIWNLITSYQLFSYNLSPSHNNIYLNCCWLTCSSPSPPAIWLIFLNCRPDKAMFLLDPSPSQCPHPLQWLPVAARRESAHYQHLQGPTWCGPNCLYNFFSFHSPLQ